MTDNGSLRTVLPENEKVGNTPQDLDLPSKAGKACPEVLGNVY